MLCDEVCCFGCKEMDQDGSNGESNHLVDQQARKLKKEWMDGCMDEKVMVKSMYGWRGG